MSGADDDAGKLQGRLEVVEGLIQVLEGKLLKGTADDRDKALLDKYLSEQTHLKSKLEQGRHP
jgi:hypothetical protein